MAKCSACSAPLAANTNKCGYCGTRNDVDLHNKHGYSVIRQETALPCPNCHNSLQTIDLHIGESFSIERCASCFGLFFSSGKLEALLEKTVGHVFDINVLQLDNINKDRFSVDNNEVKYVKCPACQQFMSRNVFGYRSGVVVDRCPSHGIWLDSGEITHLLEWKKAGGHLLQERQKHLNEANKKTTRLDRIGSNKQTDYPILDRDVDLFGTIASMLENLFE